MKMQMGLSIDEDLLILIDRIRGNTPRSHVLEDIIDIGLPIWVDQEIDRIQAIYRELELVKKTGGGGERECHLI